MHGSADAASIILPRLVSSVRMPSWRAELLRYLSFVLPGPLPRSPHQKSFGKHGDYSWQKIQISKQCDYVGYHSNSAITYGHFSAHYNIIT